MIDQTVLVSIVVPLFNRSKLVPQTIESVLSQTHNHIELLIVDDHSTDNSLQVAKQYEAKDSRVRAWQRTALTKGAPACRNEGLANSNGDYLIFLDSDDLLADQCVENRLREVASQPGLDFYVFPTEQFKNEPGDLGLPWFRKADDDLAGFLEKPLWQTTAAIWKTDSVRKLNGFREDLLAWQDWDLFVRAITQDLKYQVFEVRADNFVRRSLHDRISVGAEFDLKKLKNRKQLFRSTFGLIRDAGKLDEKRKEKLIELFLDLAIKLRKANLHSESDSWISEMAELELIDSNRVPELKSKVADASRLSFGEWKKSIKVKLLMRYHAIRKWWAR